MIWATDSLSLEVSSWSQPTRQIKRNWCLRLANASEYLSKVAGIEGFPRQAEQADHLYQLINKDDQPHFVSSLCRGYSAFKTKFITHYESIYQHCWSSSVRSRFTLRATSQTPAWTSSSTRKCGILPFTSHSDFKSFSAFLVQNYLGPRVCEFLQSFEVKRLSDLQAAAKLYDKLQSIGRDRRQTSYESNQKAEDLSSSAQSKQSETATANRVTEAGNKYWRTIKSINTGRGFDVHSLSPTSSFAIELNDDYIIHLMTTKCSPTLVWKLENIFTRFCLS